MSYALFAQRKLELTGRLNCLSLQQTQRSDEQYQLATDTLSLQQQMTSLQAAQSNQLASLYKDLADVGSKVDFSIYTDDAAVDRLNKSLESQRSSINAKINALEEEFNNEKDAINRSIYLVSVKENAIEMEVKRLDTQITSVQKQLEAVQEAEGSGIDRATPKFNGIG